MGKSAGRLVGRSVGRQVGRSASRQVGRFKRPLWPARGRWRHSDQQAHYAAAGRQETGDDANPVASASARAPFRSGTLRICLSWPGEDEGTVRLPGMAFWDITNVSVLARLQRNDDDIARNGVLGTRRAQSGLQLAPGTHDVAWEWCFGKMHRDSGQEFHTFQRYDFLCPSLARTKRT